MPVVAKDITVIVTKGNANWIPENAEGKPHDTMIVGG
jgi:hypothetical protein